MLEVLIEAAAGSHWRDRYDGVTSVHTSRRQVVCPYPYPYGFIRNTRGDDGDAVDCYVLTTETLRSGETVKGRAVGLLEQIEDGEIDHKVLVALPGSEPTLDQALYDRLREFIVSVFTPYPTVNVRLGRMLGAEEAEVFVMNHGIRAG